MFLYKVYGSVQLPTLTFKINLLIVMQHGLLMILLT